MDVVNRKNNHIELIYDITTEKCLVNHQRAPNLQANQLISVWPYN